jgi:hypothetical protein
MDRDYPPGATLEEIEGRGGIWSLYLQNAWKPLSFLTFKAGLRWDQAKYDNALGVNLVRFAQFQPRLGVAWNLRRDGRSVLRASWGRFMHPATAGAAFVFLEEPRGNQVLLPFDVWCGDFGECSHGALRERFPGKPVVFGGDVFYPVGITGLNITVSAGSLEPQYAEMLLLGYGASLGYDTELEVQYVNKKTRRLLEDTCSGNVFAFTGLRDVDDTSFYTDPGGCIGYVLGNISDLRRDYEAFILRLESRFENRLHLRMSWTVAESLGNTESTADKGFSIIGFDRFPRDFFQIYGRLSDDRRHRVRFGGYFLLPYHVEVGFDALWQSGQALDYVADCGTLLSLGAADFAAIEVDPGIVRYCGGEINGNLFLEPRGSRRGDDSYQLDLEVRKGFTRGRFRIDLIATVLNAWSTELPTSYLTQEFSSAGPWGEVLGHQVPRRYEVGLRLTF